MQRRRIAGISATVTAALLFGTNPASAWWSTPEPTGQKTEEIKTVEIPADLLEAPPTDSEIAKKDFEVPDGYVMDSFYERPDSWPKEPGRLIKQKKQPLGGWVGPIGKVNAEMTIMMYTTTNYAGEVVPVTGAFLEPKTTWKGPGLRPVVSYAYGTIGVGDQCAPSVSLKTPLHIQPRSLSVNYEMTGVAKFIDKGVSVVQTDYIGLGMPGAHTYVNSADQGHAVLDAVRAARELPGAPVTQETPVGAFGYSQGGAASASAAERQPEYAPDVNLKATYAGAPAADLLDVMVGVDASPLAEAIGYTINGLRRYHANIGYLVDAETNDNGRKALEEVKNHCVVDSFFSRNSMQPTSGWTKRGENLKQVLEHYPVGLDIVKKQRIGDRKPQNVTRIATSVNDDVVPHGQARQLALDWCQKGAAVEYVPVHDIWLPRKTTGNHLLAMFIDQTNAVKWTTDAVSGKTQPGGNCNKVAGLP